MLYRKTFYTTLIQITSSAVHVVFGLSLAYFFGASKEMDAYVVASNFIISLNALLVSSQSSTFIPFIAKYKDTSIQKDIVASILRMNIVIFSVIGAIIFFSSKWLAHALAPGLNPHDLQLTSNVLKILAFFIVVSNFCALGTGILDYNLKLEKRSFINLFQAVLGIIFLFSTVRFLGIYATAISNILAILLASMAFLFYYFKENYGFKTSLKYYNQYIKEYLILLAPVILGWLFIWIARLTDVFIASFLKSGSVSYLSYCQRINTYTSVLSTVLCSLYFPVLSKLAQPKDNVEFISVFYKGLQAIFSASLISIVFVYIFSAPFIEVLFKRGRFDKTDVLILSNLLQYYAMVLLCAPIGTYLANVYCAYRKTRFATLLSIIAAILNIALNFILGFYIGIKGIVLAASITFLAGCTMQFLNIGRFNPVFKLRKALGAIAKPFLAGCFVFLPFYLLHNFVFKQCIDAFYGQLIYLITNFIAVAVLFLFIGVKLNINLNIELYHLLRLKFKSFS